MVTEKKRVPQIHVAALGSLLEFAIHQLPRRLPRLVMTDLRGDWPFPRQEAAAINYGVTCNLRPVVSHRDNVAQSSPVVYPHFQNAVTNQIVSTPQPNDGFKEGTEPVVQFLSEKKKKKNHKNAKTQSYKSQKIVLSIQVRIDQKKKKKKS